MAWLARENATLLAVLDFAASNGLADHVGRLAWAFTTYLNRSGQRHERAAANRTALAMAHDGHSQLVVLPALAQALGYLGRFDEVEPLLDEAAELAARFGENHHVIQVHLAYVQALELQERHHDALDHAERVWELTREQPSSQYYADALVTIARQRTWLGSPTEALPLGEKALAIYRKVGHAVGEAY